MVTTKPARTVRLRIPDIKPGTTFESGDATYTVVTRGVARGYWRCRRAGITGRVKPVPFSALRIRECIRAKIAKQSEAFVFSTSARSSSPAEQSATANTVAPSPKAGFRDLDRINDDLAVIRRQFERTDEMLTAGELDLLRMAITLTHDRYEQLAFRMRGEAELAANHA